MRVGVALLLFVLAGSALADDAVTVRWLGVAGFSIRAGDSVLLQDPYLSRPGLWQLLTSWYQPDREALERLMRPDGPAPELAHANAILIGHSHFDHLGDAPWLAQRTGARVIGSETTIAIARAYGLSADQLERSEPGLPISVGPFHVRVIESRHAKVMFSSVLDGTYEAPPEAPLHALSFRLGDARLYLVRHEPSGVEILLVSSAALYEPALEKLRSRHLSVDLLLAATTGAEPGYARALISTFHPRIVVPHHYESFLEPLDSPDAVTPRDPAALAAFEAELREAAAAEGIQMEVRRLGLFESIGLPGGAPPAKRGG